MTPSNSPFQSAWWAPSLQEHRPCDGTYCVWEYASLPAIDTSLFEGNFQWLPPMTAELRDVLAAYDRPEASAHIVQRMGAIKSAAKQMGLQLPEDFLKFMASPELQVQIPSCTACYFDLSDIIVQLPIDDGGFLIRFYNDQQDVLLWYLYLTPQSESCIVVSDVMFDSVNLEGVTPQQIKARLEFCAGSFEEFIYRWWLENDIWMALEEGRPLTEVQTAYLAHYQP